MRIQILGGALALVVGAAAVSAEDWPQWGGTPDRNMVAKEKGSVPDDFVPGEFKGDSEEIDLKTTKGVKWVRKLGSQSYGNVTVSRGRVFVGTNNEGQSDPKYKGDRALVLCLSEKTGELIWQLSAPKLGAGKVSDWEYLGMCSSPAVDGDRVYVITNLCQVVCLDYNGMADGNQGYQDEAKYTGGKGAPIPQGKGDADIIWVYDMRAELGIFPHNITSSSPLVQGDYVYVNTSNGADWSHVNIPSPRAPCIVAINKKTGELAGEEVSEISRRLMHGSWSSPSYGEVKGKPLVFFGAGDGHVYGFEAKPVEDEDGAILKEVWRFDCNPPEYKMRDGKKIRYASPPGPSELIASPVFHDGKVYAAIGQDPEHGEGVGRLVCIDASGKGDISKTGVVWEYRKIKRTISTVSIADGLIYAADYSGFLHCLDAKTGEAQWVHDTKGHIWASTLVADGKVFLGNEDGILSVLAASKTKKLLREVEFNVPLYGSPIYANGVLYVQSQTHLYAISK